MTDEAKYQILKEHQIDEAVCEALGINLDELKTLEDDNYPNDGMEYEQDNKVG